MKVIVFGGSGFLGSHVADILSEKGHKVRIFDNVESPYLRNDQEMIVGDVLDTKAVAAVVKGADVVYNFAAVADIDVASTMPIETVKVNVLGNANILDAARKEKIKRFVFSSSIYVYSDSGTFYRCSKQSCELFIECFQKAYGLDYTILRYGSLYGPRSDERNWVYRILKQALLDKKITREGDGEEVREYIYVQDAARLTADILKAECKNRCFIVSGNEQFKIRDLMVMIKEILRGEVELEFKPSTVSEHYQITPYVFKPQVATKIYSNEHFDVGQGLLNVLDEIHERFVLNEQLVGMTSANRQTF